MSRGWFMTNRRPADHDLRLGLELDPLSAGELACRRGPVLEQSQQYRGLRRGEVLVGGEFLQPSAQPGEHHPQLAGGSHRRIADLVHLRQSKQDS